MKRSCILDKRVCKVFSASAKRRKYSLVMVFIFYVWYHEMLNFKCTCWLARVIEKTVTCTCIKKNFDPVIQMRRYSSTVSPIFLRTRFWIFTSFYKFKQCSTVYLTLNITVFNVSNQVRRIGHCLSCVKNLQKLFIYT